MISRGVGIDGTGRRLIARVLTLVSGVGQCLAPPVLRVALALPFLRSGFTRWDRFPTLSASTQFLFADQFKVHILHYAFELPAPLTVAYVTALAEIALPLLLLVGFATRFAALGLLVMTGVIQLVVPEGWQNFHLYWAALALALMALGAGPLSLDALAGAIAGARSEDAVWQKGAQHVDR